MATSIFSLFVGSNTSHVAFLLPSSNTFSARIHLFSLYLDSTRMSKHKSFSSVGTSQKPHEVSASCSLLPRCPCNARLLRYEELDQALLISALTFQQDDVPHLRPPSCPNRNRFAQPDAGHPASNSSSLCLASESVSGW